MSTLTAAGSVRRLGPLAWRALASPAARLARRPAVVLAVLPLLVYGRFVLGDEVANADVFLAYRPAHAWLAEGLRQGQLRLWNPYILGGFPLAFSEYGWLSPLTWLPLVLFGGHAGFYLGVALYVALSGLATYALARAWDCSRGAALLAGLVYSQSLFVVGGAPLINQAAAYWALPALLWCVDRRFAGVPLAAPAAAATIALALLGSHPQLALIALAPAALYAAGRGVGARRARPVAGLLAAAVVGAAISSVRFLPTLPLIAASVRSAGLSLEAGAIGSVNPVALAAGLLLPSLGVPRYLAPQWTAYVGPLPLALALVGLRRRRGWERAFLACAGAAGLLLALGSYTPLYWLILRSPLLAYFREPSRFLLWWVLALAVGAAFGLDVLRAAQRPASKVLGRLVIAGFVLLVAAFAIGHLALRFVEPPIVRWGQFQALSRAAAREYPPEHYLATFLAAWRQVLRATNPLEPGLLLPLAACGLAIWWWRPPHRAPPRSESAGLQSEACPRAQRRVPHPPTSASRRAAAALLCTGLPLLAYGQVRLPAIPASVVEESVPSAALARSGLPATARARAVVREPAAGPQAAPDAAVWPRTLSWLPLAADFEQRVALEARGAGADVASYRLLKRLVTPNLGLALGVPAVDGYENLMTREQALLAAALGSERAAAPSEASLLPRGLRDRGRLFGDRWGLFAAAGGGALFSVERLQPPTWPAAVRYEPAAVPAGPDSPAVNVFLVTRPVPHAFVVPEWVTAGSAEDAIDDLIQTADASGEPRAVVTDPAAPAGMRLPRRRTAPAGPLGPDGARSDAYEARIVRYDERVVEVETTAGTDALLVLLDAHAPGWTATVTGAPAPILTANVAFRAVEIPAGRHLVRFRYTPPLWREALALAGTSATVLAAWTLWAIARRTPTNSP